MKYERLTENGSNYATCDGEHDIIVKFSEDGSEEPIYDFDSICVKLNRLVELEDKIESGKILELPCKMKLNISDCNVDVYQIIYSGKYGYMRTEIVYGEVEAEARLKELRNK